MNNLTIFILLLIIAVIVILLIIVISLLNKKEPVQKNTIVRKVDEYIPLPTTYNLFLPVNIEKIGKNELPGIVKKVFNSYKYFDYKSMNINDLEKKEWHTWQVSLMLKAYKENEDFFIAGQEDIFHSFLLNSNENDIKSLMRDVMKKYNNYVNIRDTKDALCKEYIWTNKDVSIIFYFLANYKEYSI